MERGRHVAGQVFAICAPAFAGTAFAAGESVLGARTAALRLVTLAVAVVARLTPASGIAEDEVGAVLPHARVLLAPSTYESSGIAALEAMGAGVLAVGTPNPCLSFLARHEAALRVGDDALGSAVEGVLVDADLSASMRRARWPRAEHVATTADPRRYLDFFTTVA